MTGGDVEIIGEIGGVPFLHAPRPEGPTTAVLMFRVGACDETLPIRGITHLVEHLALFRFGMRPYGYNGSVELLRTTFVAQGEPAQVHQHMLELTRSLHDPPLDRLRVERQILQTEASGRGRGPWEAFTSLRFGPRGAGLTGYEEYGLRWLEAPAVHDWAARYFTAGNARVWIWGDVDGLQLELPPGERHPSPPLPPATSSLPAWFTRSSDGVGLSHVTERTTAASSAARHLERALMSELRYARGVSYGASVSYTPITAVHAHVLVWTDALAESLAAALDGLVDVVDRFAQHGPTQAELDEELAAVRTAWTKPDATGARLEQAATRVLMGRTDEEDWVDELARTRPEDGATALRRGLETALYLVPQGVEPPAGITARAQRMPEDSQQALAGRRLIPRAAKGAAARDRLVVAAEGLTLEKPSATYTVRFDDCAAVLAWENGSRGLIGNDGIYVGFDVREWIGVKDATRAVDEHGPAPFVQMGAVEDAGVASERTMRLSNRGLIWAAAVVTACVVAAIAIASAQWDAPDAVATAAFTVAFIGIIALVLLAMTLLSRLASEAALRFARRRSLRKRPG